MKFKQLLGTIALGSALVMGMTGLAQAGGHHNGFCDIEGKVAKIVVEAHKPARVYIGELAALPQKYFRFETDSNRVLSLLGDAQAANNTVFVRGDERCREYAHDYKWDGGEIIKAKVFSHY